MGDEVIIPPMTFAATAEVVLYTGAKPVFCDIEDKNYNIDPEKIEDCITEKTKAIIPVHYAGHPCDMKKILAIAKKNGLAVIEDAAHALPAKCGNDMVGNIGDITCFSFYATKNICTAEGGMITTNDDQLADKMRILSLHGISKDAWKRYSSEGSWYYEILHAGFKYNFTDVQAAMGIHQLRKLDAMQKRRRELVKIYYDELSDIEGVTLPNESKGYQHAWHLFSVLFDPQKLSITRDAMIDELKMMNIGTSVHFIPLHLHPLYQKTLATKMGDMPVSERVYSQEISLPLYPRMSDEDVHDVAWAIKKIILERRS
jgi:dTDP-4-amino-4,6-dideoxygalactose transaminase